MKPRWAICNRVKLNSRYEGPLVGKIVRLTFQFTKFFLFLKIEKKKQDKKRNNLQNLKNKMKKKSYKLTNW